MISIVIPAYNEEKLLPHCLDSLVGQETTREYEVIVVDNNSTDKTPEICASYEGKLTIRVILEKVKGRGPARQRGFQEARGDILLSTDADTIVPKNWIEVFVTNLEKNNPVAVTGSCKIEDCSPFTNYAFNILQPFFMRLYRVFYGHYWLSGFSFGIYRIEYVRSGGFKRTLNGVEDIDLSFRVSKQGSIHFIPDCPVVFSGRRFKHGFVGGLFSYVAIFVQYLKYKKEHAVLSDIR